MLIANLLIFIIRAVRPLLGPYGLCRFEISCGNFAIMQLKELPTSKAIYAIIKRVFSCNPFF